MGKHYDSAFEAVRKALEANKIIVAYDALNHKTTSCGPYHEAVDCGYKYAVLGKSDWTFKSIGDAAAHFIDRVGHTRAREAARAALKRD